MTKVKTWIIYAYEGMSIARQRRRNKSLDYVIRAVNRIHAIRMFHEKTNKRYKHDGVKISIRVFFLVYFLRCFSRRMWYAIGIPFFK